MTDLLFKKEDFIQEAGRYMVEVDQGVSKGIDLIVERKKDDGEYEVILAEIIRSPEEKVFVAWSEPFDGRVVSDEYRNL